MFTSTPISSSDQSDLRTLIYFVNEGVSSREIGEKIVILVGVVIYSGIVWFSGSTLFSVAGGVVLLTYRTLSIEIFLKRRLTLLTDILVEMDKRHCERAEQVHRAISDVAR